MKRKNILSIICILLVAAYWISSFTYYERWKKNQIVWDVVSYYGYLPALFIYDDITLKFTDKDPEFFALKYWPERSPNGGRVIKTSMGVSYLYAPFFFLGHLYAGWNGELQNGYSLPYQFFLMLGSLVYILLGLYFLRSLLLKYFSDTVVAASLLSVYFGTNLLYYSAADPLLAHSYVFSVGCIFIWAVDRWFNSPGIWISVLAGLSGGLLCIMRPTMVLYTLLPLLYGLHNVTSIKERVSFLKNNIGKVFLFLLCYTIPIMPQLAYWKYITGDWFYFSYTGENFFWNDPHILEGLIGYRNGWLLYTPIMLFGILGLFLMRGTSRRMQLPVLCLLPVFIYTVHSWWCWWFSGFGHRAYIDIYPLLVIPIAAFYEYGIERYRRIRTGVITVAAMLVLLNMFQEWQFEKGVIHFDSMTKKSYWLGFMKKSVNGEWWINLRKPNYERRLKGLPEYYKTGDTTHYMKQEKDFEKIPQDKDSIFYTQSPGRDSISYVLNRESPASPALRLTGEDILHENPDNRFALAEFYFKDHVPASGEHFFVISFDCDTGTYHYEATDLTTISPKPNSWNRIRVRVDNLNLRNDKDIISIYLWSKIPDKELLIEGLWIESVYR